MKVVFAGLAVVIFSACGGTVSEPGADAGTAKAADAGTAKAGSTLGAPCASNGSCDVGTCLAVDGPNAVRICSTNCKVQDTTCAPGLQCFIPGDMAGYCLTPCSDDAECTSPLSCQKRLTADVKFCLPPQ